MHQTEILVNKDDLTNDGNLWVSPDLAGGCFPEWYNQIAYPLTFAPFFERAGECFYVRIGNSGLSFFGTSFYETSLEMSFAPNASTNPDREYENDLFTSMEIWAKAFYTFIIWYASSVNPEIMSRIKIVGETNSKMHNLRKRLLNGLIPKSAIKESEPSRGLGNIDYCYLLQPFLQQKFLQKKSEKSIFFRLIQRLEGKEPPIMINPRLSKRDEKTIPPVYIL